MINTLRKEAQKYATILKQTKNINYETVDVNVLADGYCKAFDEGDENNKNLFISGLILRFWYTIKKMADKSPNMGTDLSEFANWLYEAIEYACKYRKWQDPANKVNAQQCINQCIETIRLQHYYQANLKKSRVNYNTVSLDATHSYSPDDAEVSLLDTIEDEEQTAEQKRFAEAADTRTFIQRYINKKKLIEAIILDNIAFGDTQKEVKHITKVLDEEGNETKAVSYTYEFWPFKCVQTLSQLSTDYAEYFLENYDVKPEELNAALEAIRKANNTKLYTYLRKCIEGCKATMGAR